MKHLSLKNRIANYLQRQEDWVASGRIQELAQADYRSPQNAGRRCRELVKEDVLEVEYRKGHAWYRYKLAKPEARIETLKPKVEIKIINGMPMAVMI